MDTREAVAPRTASPSVVRYGGTALVTGASEGIGRAFAVRLAKAGHTLVLVARRAGQLEALARELHTSFGTTCHVLARDLAEHDAVLEVVAEARRLDVGLLVAAAGFGTSGRFIDTRLDDELAMIDVNCRAVATLCHELGAHFVARGRGGMVLMSSLLAFQGVPRAANYAATKAYVQALAEGLAVELGPLGVDVVASAPGPIRSGFAHRADMVMSLAQTPDVVASATLRAMGRWGTVRPGWLSKFLEASLALLPRWGRVRMLALVMRGMTRHRA